MPYFKVKYKFPFSKGIPNREYEAVSLGKNEKDVREKYTSAGYEVLSVTFEASDPFNEETIGEFTS